MVNPQKEKYVYEKVYSKMLDYTKYLQTFGDMGNVRSFYRIKENL